MTDRELDDIKIYDKYGKKKKKDKALWLAGPLPLAPLAWCIFFDESL